MEGVNPIIILLMFVARCLVPLVIMLALSYVLRRLGWIKDPPPPPNGVSALDDRPGVRSGMIHG